MLTAAGTLARSGVLVRNLQGLEALAAVDTLVFDKTGTLTRDGLALSSFEPAAGEDANEALALAALLARQSIHPASRAIAQAGAGATTAWKLDTMQEMAGLGLDAWVQGTGGRRHLRLGSALHAGVPGEQPVQGVLLAEQTAQGWRTLARFVLSEDVRPEAAAVVQALGRQGIEVMLLSGDREDAARAMAARVGIARAEGGCSPQDKLARMQQAQAAGHHVAMVGDGLHDGPVLAGAHVSFAFGRAVPLAQSRADFVVLGDSLELVLQACLLSRRTLQVVRQNMAWAAAYNAVSIPLALAGFMPAWVAGLGMALSSLLVVLNAARLARGLPPAATKHTGTPAAPAASVAIQTGSTATVGR
jgi:Cu2+-exporting ATPase